MRMRIALILSDCGARNKSYFSNQENSMKIMHLISGGDVGGAKTHVLSLLKGLGQTQTVRLVCFTGGAWWRSRKT